MRLVRLRSGGGELEAAFAPDAGLVGCSLTHRGEELLAQRNGLEEYARSGSTFGIPFLHPWANRLADFSYAVAGQEVELDRDSGLLKIEEHGLPIHGLAPHALRWEVVEEHGDALRAETEFDRERLAGFPFPHRLALEATLADDALTIQTTLTPTSAVSVPVAFGYHPYLRLPAESRSTVEIEVPVPTRLVLDERQIPTGERVRAAISPGPLAERTFDDGFADVTDGTTFVVRGSGRTISVTFLEGYHFAQVYAPSETEFISYEPMTAPTNALTSGDSLTRVRPGDAYSAAFRISVG